MKNFYYLFLLLSIVILSSGCASILSKSDYPLTITSLPNGADVIVRDWNDREVFAGTTPAIVYLDASESYFKRAYYTVIVSRPGYYAEVIPVEFVVDPMFYLNLLFYPPFGMLIVDPITGAMYHLKDDLMYIDLREQKIGERPDLKMLDWANIPADWKARLVEIKP